MIGLLFAFKFPGKENELTIHCLALAKLKWKHDNFSSRFTFLIMLAECSLRLMERDGAWEDAKWQKEV